MCVFEKRVRKPKRARRRRRKRKFCQMHSLTQGCVRLAPRSMPTTSLAWPVVGWADCGACEPYRCLGNQCSSKRRGGVQQRTPRRIAYFRNATNGATALNNDGCELQSTEDPRLALGRSKPLPSTPVSPRCRSINRALLLALWLVFESTQRPPPRRNVPRVGRSPLLPLHAYSPPPPTDTHTQQATHPWDRPPTPPWTSASRYV